MDASEQPKVKLSIKARKEQERETEQTMAKEMPWENIMSKIAELKTKKSGLDYDIDALVTQKRKVESEISKYMRIANFKRKQAGA